MIMHLFFEGAPVVGLAKLPLNLTASDHHALCCMWFVQEGVI